MQSNHHNLRRFIFGVHIVLSTIAILFIFYRLEKVEKTLDERTPLVETVIETKLQSLENRADIEAILLHHVELLESQNE